MGFECQWQLASAHRHFYNPLTFHVYLKELFNSNQRGAFVRQICIKLGYLPIDALIELEMGSDPTGIQVSQFLFSNSRE